MREAVARGAAAEEGAAGGACGAAGRHPEDRLAVTFWGVRGSIPTPGPTTLRYGGETTALEIHAGSHMVLVDCGSGARLLGKDLARRGLDRIDLLFTHTHLDHVCGLPFFFPAYSPDVALNLWAGHLPEGGSLEEIVARLMSPPIFPVPTTALKATTFNSFKAGETIVVRPGLAIRTVALNHPGCATGYRIDWEGSSLAVITDHEHGDPARDEGVAAFVEGCDVMIYDAMYTEAEYANHVGWGHSTPERALALAEVAEVRMPVLFHHDPRRDDDALDALRRDAQARFPGAEVAREGMTIAIRRGRIETSVNLAHPAQAAE